MPSVIRIVTVFAVVAVCSVGQTASARVVQTITLTPHELRYPTRIALGPSSRLYVLDSGDSGSSPVMMSVYSLSGRVLRRWRIATESNPIPNMVLDPVGNVYVVSTRTP